MFTNTFPFKTPTWDWPDLDGKIVQVKYLPANPEVLEGPMLHFFDVENKVLYTLDNLVRGGKDD